VPDYLVFFVVDPVDDELASSLRALVHALADEHPWTDRPPGWFDDPAARPSQRTAGAFLRVDGAAARDDVEAMWATALAASATLDVSIEVQWREEILGQVRAGVPDLGLATRMNAIAPH
jgi:hypothetical protein